MLWFVAVASAVQISSDPIPAGGGPVRVFVDGLNAFESARVLAGPTAGAGPCFAALGGSCVGIANPKLLGAAVADGSGHAELVATFPSSLVAGQRVRLQAAVPRGPGGASSVLSPVVTTDVGAVDADGDGFDTTTDCDDGDDTVFPGAIERCDGIDGDCDPTTPDDGIVTVGTTNYTSIADGVNFAPPGDTVAVCAGTWSEAITIDRDVTVLGVDGPDRVVVDATGLGAPVLTLEGPATITIDGLTLTGGDGGIEARAHVDLVLLRSVVTDNHTTGSGGGIEDAGNGVAPTSMYLEDVEISGNSAGVHGGGMTTAFGPHELVDVRFLSNTAARAGGGLMTSSNGVITITGSTFHDNHASSGAGLDQGGGISMNYTAANVVVTDSDFGVGATENLPNDVRIYDLTSPVGFTFFQDHETFTCSSVTNTCQ